MKKYIPQMEPLVREKWAKSVYDQILTGWIGVGETTEKFENKIREICGCEYVISTTSGTAAIILSIIGMDLPKKSSILFPNYGFLAGANAIKSLGYDVELVDIDPTNLCISDIKLREKLEECDNVSCVLFINFNAYTGYYVENIKNICDEYNVSMLEDSSQALGMKNAGVVGDVGIFSFSVPKLVTTGQGGVMVTNDEKIYKLANRYKDQGGDWRKTKIHKHLGINLKFDDIHSSYGLSQLNDLSFLLSERKRIFDKYKECLGVDNFYHNWQDSSWMIILKTDSPTEIMKELKSNNIQSVNYYKPTNTQPIYLNDGEFPISSQVVKKSLYLPSSLTLTDDDIEYVCDIIKKMKK